MSGPNYPRPNPVPGSNAIGGFVIGVSPIGDIPPFDPWVTVISQYANSDIITSFVTDFNEALDQTRNMDEFFDHMFNPDTADGYGLDVIGRIVGVSRSFPASLTTRNLGFQEASDANATPFNDAPFYTGPTLDSVLLDDWHFRQLIRAKMKTNMCGGSIAEINDILMTLFPGRGNSYVVDNQDMTITYVFSSTLTAAELAMLAHSDVLPTPAGVSATIESA